MSWGFYRLISTFSSTSIITSKWCFFNYPSNFIVHILPNYKLLQLTSEIERFSALEKENKTLEESLDLPIPESYQIIAQNNIFNKCLMGILLSELKYKCKLKTITFNNLN